MSRIGYKTVVIPEGVTIERKDDQVTVKGPKGELTEAFAPTVEMKVDGNEVNFEPTGKYDNKMRAMHGTQRANFANMVEGVTDGFAKTLKLVGVGYRTQLKGKTLTLNVGYSNPVEVPVPEDIEVKVPDNTTIEISGINKQHVGDFAAKVRAIRSPEPYKGKGIRYAEEHITLKEGKTGK
ncbi:50S ribosomal protein L6 [Fructilactobacillus lindneri]|uniref:Large ribosomal subunit protein uL6 n=1 Tax=Fructilactobacillus lindneri TaxID=53444 RepID=A0AB33BMS2_9LACO|nr:50S ribosomal protein L6 [Fructilactobacillus lindneri]ANZ57937.1 50S ribosomal protein L6 [Fructilactobacillus lindneri]ANZ59207.1 50S ribosomal protein L6 [Fructilactobacillus lindneri]POG98257.1 50S ribosomal protein L6 [Fructilactobacillus lindneri]POH01626.1 50S ribosomal protein L6 [Fructilactobacillus lindneri]POH03469.1 50S ribosomal protein L6 [Fructilactobacillus lindneri]